MNFAAFYRIAGGIGVQFSELRAMSLWQFDQIFRGWRQANMPPETPPPTEAEFETADWNW